MQTRISAFAEYEKTLITARLSGGRKTKAKQGGFAGGRVPIGYTTIKRKLVVNGKASTVKRAFELCDSMPDASLQKIADILNAEGFTTKEGKPFFAMQVKRILDRRFLYEGEYHYSDVETKGQHEAILKEKKSVGKSVDEIMIKAIGKAYGLK